MPCVHGERTPAFLVGRSHEDLLKKGSLPLSVVGWLLLDDRSSLDQVQR